jgi:hypothetical protein
MSGLLNVRLIAEPPAAAGAVDRLAEVLDLDRRDGPYPSRKSPGLVRYYLAGRLRAAGAPLAPLAEIEDLKARRDLGGELEAINGHWAAMEAQPWWPPQLGDVAIGHPTGGPDPYGETFLAEQYPVFGVRFRSVSRTRGQFVPEDGYGIEDLWFEWSAISIVRAGTVYSPQRRAVR